MGMQKAPLLKARGLFCWIGGVRYSAWASGRIITLI